MRNIIWKNFIWRELIEQRFTSRALIVQSLIKTKLGASDGFHRFLTQFFFAVQACSMLFFLGCAGFQKGPTVAESIKAKGIGGGGTERLIYTDIQWQGFRDGVALEALDLEEMDAYQNFQDWLDQELKTKGWGTGVRDPGPADFKMTVQVQSSNDGRFGNMILTAATFFIVPYVARATHRIDVTIRNRAGETVFSKTAKNEIGEWVHILLLPLSPFLTPSRKEAAAWKATLDSIF